MKKLGKLGIIILFVALIAVYIILNREVKVNTPDSVENMMLNLNQGSYSGFSRDFSAALKQSINQEDFEEMKKAVYDTSGNYKSKTLLLESEGLGVKHSIYSCDFEDGKITLAVTFNSTNSKIEGIYLDSEELRGLFNN